MRTLLLILFGLQGIWANAQADPMPWRPLSDSVFQVLGLSEDQAKRIRTIDQQYEEERMKLKSSPETLPRME
ncbi:MAG TPA: hypothetical protein VHL57_07035, partial [Flavobacteriales bacterium]|nr:hypothetical protein [Flavobacteriales bacterium]